MAVIEIYCAFLGMSGILRGFSAALMNFTEPQRWRGGAALLYNFCQSRKRKFKSNSSRNRPAHITYEKTNNPPLMLESQDFQPAPSTTPPPPAALSCRQFWASGSGSAFCMMSHSSSIIPRNAALTRTRPLRGNLSSPSADPLPRTILMWHYVRAPRKAEPPAVLGSTQTPENMLISPHDY